jgi:hypothetical protein
MLTIRVLHFYVCGHLHRRFLRSAQAKVSTGRLRLYKLSLDHMVPKLNRTETTYILVQNAVDDGWPVLLNHKLTLRDTLAI